MRKIAFQLSGGKQTAFPHRIFLFGALPVSGKAARGKREVWTVGKRWLSLALAAMMLVSCALAEGVEATEEPTEPAGDETAAAESETPNTETV